MCVLVTVLANMRRALELHIFRTHRHLVTSATLHRAMCSEQGKLCFRMVKPVHVRPRPRVVTSFAAERRAIGAPLRHAIVEFAVMDILVTAGAGHVLKDKGQDLIGPAGGAYFVAIGAGDGSMCTGQGETSFAMFGDCKGGAVKVQNGMTILAFV